MSPPYYAQINGAKAVINFPTFGNLINWEGTRWAQADKGVVEFGANTSLINDPVAHAIAECPVIAVSR